MVLITFIAIMGGDIPAHIDAVTCVQCVATMRSHCYKFVSGNFDIEKPANFKYTSGIYQIWILQFRNFLQICSIISLRPTLEPT
jgi:hypothetical protein